MPTLPWITPNPAEPGTRAIVMASRFEVRSVRDVPRFFSRSLAIWNQLQVTPGVLGASLVARPARRTFCTLSAWESQEAMQDFARSEPHRSIMGQLASTMRESTFVYWEVPVEKLPVDWAEAERRLAEQRLLKGAAR